MAADPKLLYWTAAFANLGVLMVCAYLGVARIRRGDVRGHRRMMVASMGLVVLFLASYGLKVGFLGKEDRSAWVAHDYAVLWVHESCIAVMLGAGTFAALRAFRFRKGLPASLPASELRAAARRGHRRAGWTAVVASGLAFVTAAGILFGMYARAG